MISYGLSVNSPVLTCNESAFNSLVDSSAVKQICDLIASEPDHKRQGELKKRLPFFCFHASFKGKRRVSKEAVPSGFAMIDLDGIDNPREVWSEIEPRKAELDIVLAHVTPSTRGLRLVFIIHHGMDLAEAQQWMARKLNLQNVDSVVKDLARCSFAVPRSYILHLDKRLFEDPPLPSGHPLPLGREGNSYGNASLENSERKGSAGGSSESSSVTNSPSLFTGGGKGGGSAYNYPLIISKWLSIYLRNRPGYRTFDAPAEGDRNNTLYDLCRDLRNVCDYSFQKILDIVPTFGLERNEVEQTVLSALKAERKTPFTLNKALKELTDDGTFSPASQESINDVDDFNESFLEQLPELPPMMRALLNGAERKFHMPILIGMMPMLCSYADKVIFRYADGRWRRPNMMSFIIGPPMSGKSAVTTQLSPLLEPMKKESRKVRDLQDEARRKNNERSDKERGKTFASFIKKLNMDITDAELLYNQKAASKAGTEVEGHFLPRKQFMFTEEAGVVMKAAKNDKLTSAWRCAFDNGEWGKDVHADNAVSGEVNLSFDFTALCTMGVLQKLLDPVNIENGTASRMLLGLMPATNFEGMPWFGEQKVKDCSIISEVVERLSETSEAIDSKTLIKAITKWSNDMAEQCREKNDLDRDMLRRRAGIIGQTAAVIFALVENKRIKGKLSISKKAITFGLVFADYALETQCQIFKDYAQTASVKISITGERKNTKNKKLFDTLPDVFSLDDIKREKQSYSAAKTFVHRCMKDGIIKKVGKSTYKKTTYEDYNRKKV